jgi:hypothetical protein
MLLNPYIKSTHFICGYKIMCGDIMNSNLIAAILSVLVVIIGLYEIFGLGEYTWTNYLSVILFAVVFILTIKEVLNLKRA